MEIEEKIGQLLMVGFEGLQAPAYILEWLKQGHLGGIIYFARNVDTPEQLAELSQSLFGKVLAVNDLRKMIVMVSKTALAGCFGAGVGKI